MDILTAPRYIILHCSATPDTKTKSWDAIRRYHVEAKGWDDIGYHYGVEDVDGDYVLLPGRSYYYKGAHCRAGGRNHDSIGLCVVGKFDDIAPSPFLVRYVADALTILSFSFGIKPEDIRGHCEYEANKTCPGKLWPLDQTRDMVARRLRDDSPIGRHIYADMLRLP